MHHINMQIPDRTKDYLRRLALATIASYIGYVLGTSVYAWHEPGTLLSVLDPRGALDKLDMIIQTAAHVPWFGAILAFNLMLSIAFFIVRQTPPVWLWLLVFVGFASQVYLLKIIWMT